MTLGMPVAEMLARMSSREFTEWMAYYNLEPFGEERADLRQAVTVTPVVNLLRALGGAKGGWVKPEQLLPFPPEKETPTADDLRSKALTIFPKRR